MGWSGCNSSVRQKGPGKEPQATTPSPPRGQDAVAVMDAGDLHRHHAPPGRVLTDHFAGELGLAPRCGGPRRSATCRDRESRAASLRVRRRRIIEAAENLDVPEASRTQGDRYLVGAEVVADGDGEPLVVQIRPSGCRRRGQWDGEMVCSAPPTLIDALGRGPPRRGSRNPPLRGPASPSVRAARGCRRPAVELVAGHVGGHDQVVDDRAEERAGSRLATCSTVMPAAITVAARSACRPPRPSRSCSEQAPRCGDPPIFIGGTVPQAPRISLQVEAGHQDIDRVGQPDGPLGRTRSGRRCWPKIQQTVDPGDHGARRSRRRLPMLSRLPVPACSPSSQAAPSRAGRSDPRTRRNRRQRECRDQPLGTGANPVEWRRLAQVRPALGQAMRRCPRR